MIGWKDERNKTYFVCFNISHICIGWKRWNGDNTSKSGLFFQLVSAVAVLKGHEDLWFTSIEDYLTLFYNWRQFLRSHPETKNNGSEQTVCIIWLRLGLGSDHVVWKSQVLWSRSFFTVLVFLLMSQLMLCMFLSCSMIMNFPWLLKPWSCFLKCLQAGIALGFLTPFCGYWPYCWILFLIYQHIEYCRYSILVGK